MFMPALHDPAMVQYFQLVRTDRFKIIRVMRTEILHISRAAKKCARSHCSRWRTGTDGFEKEKTYNAKRDEW